ncbi:MAG: hypothetical protein HYS39_00580, partial [Proteobacteria bacterium]|nr:hypothetical protein [Pseudomonadota bacterium]
GHAAFHGARHDGLPLGIYTAVFLISSFILILGGCETQKTTYPSLVQKKNQLQHKTILHSVIFQGSQLSLAERNALIEKITPKGPGRTSVHITLPDHKTGLDLKRLSTLENLLKRNNIKPKQIHYDEALVGSKHNTMDIQLDMYRVIPAQCPDWSHPGGNADGTIMPSNHGCATERNFALIVDDVAVLFKGQPRDATDAVREAKTIDDYRQGQRKPLTVQTLSGSTTSGGRPPMPPIMR